MRVNSELYIARSGIYTDDYNNYFEINSRCVLVVKGCDNNIAIGRNVKNLLSKDEIMYIECNGSNNNIIIKDNTTYGSDWKIIMESNGRLFMGYDCMLSNEVSIYIHNNCSVEIGNHVWLGLRTSVIGTAKIGTGSIVGACGVANNSFPNNCIIAGNPGQVIRKNIAWHRNRDERDFFLVPEEYRCETEEAKEK